MIAIGVALTVITGCTSELERLAAVIAGHTGSTATEVEAGLRATLRGKTDEELVQAAQRLADRTSWIDLQVAKISADRAETRRAVVKSSCEWLKLLQIAGKTDQERNQDLERYIVDQLQGAGLQYDAAKSAEIRAGIIAQMESYKTSGHLDYPLAFQDGACFLFG